MCRTFAGMMTASGTRSTELGTSVCLSVTPPLEPSDSSSLARLAYQVALIDLCPGFQRIPEPWPGWCIGLLSLILCPGSERIPEPAGRSRQRTDPGACSRGPAEDDDEGCGAALESIPSRSWRSWRLGVRQCPDCCGAALESAVPG